MPISRPARFQAGSGGRCATRGRGICSAMASSWAPAIAVATSCPAPLTRGTTCTSARPGNAPTRAGAPHGFCRSTTPPTWQASVKAPDPPPTVELRDVEPPDIELFLQFQSDQQAADMAVQLPRERVEHYARWQAIGADPAKYAKTVIADG